MTTLATDANNDIFLTNKGFTLIEDAESIANVCERRLKTQRGELQFDLSRGVPWFETIFASQRNSVSWAASMKKTIKAVSGVTGISSFEFEVKENVVEYIARINTIYGEAVVSG